MRLKRFDLTAYGHFTDRTLTFDSEEPGLHIIFGPNEAGKSSSLRALKVLLYGFPTRTPDDFLHSYGKLLVGGCLENSAGEEIFFQRRKKKTGDILDPDGNPLDSAVLAPFILGLEPEIFETLYGLDHDTLVGGGEEILAQKGEVGQALFAAGAGISSLREVIEQLDKDASDLFKRSGKKPAINMAVARFKKLKKEARAAALSSKEWKTHQKALKEAEAERARLEAERAELDRELHRLERLARAVPELATLKSRKEQLGALGEVTPLPPDFIQRHQRVTREIRETGLRLQRDTDRRATLAKRREEVSFNRALLEQAELVDDFHQRLGEYRKGQKDRPERNGMRLSLRRDADGLLKQVRPDLPLEEVEILRPVLTRKRTVQTLAGQYEAINQRLGGERKKIRTAGQEIEEIDRELAVLPHAMEPRKLLQAVKLARKAGDLDLTLEKERRGIEQGRKECLGELKRLSLWSGDLSALMTLSLPLPETVRRFESRYGEISDERRDLEKDRKKSEKELKKTRADIRKAAYEGEVPTEEELDRTRAKRDRGWRLLRRQWMDGEDVGGESRDYDPHRPLPEAYEGHVGQSDLIADRLRREATRVANAAALRAREESIGEALAESAGEKTALDQREKELEASWRSEWQASGIIPLSPKEMNGWLAGMDKLRFKAGDILKKEEEILREASRRDGLAKGVVKELNALAETGAPEGGALGPVLVLAETVLERIGGRAAELEKLKERRKIAGKALGRAEADLAEALEEIEKWREQWNSALKGLGLGDEVSPLEAVDLMEILRSCFEKLKEADDLEKRIKGIDRDAGALEKEFKALLAKVAPDMPPLPLDQAILNLRALLEQARKNGTLHDELSEALESLEQEISSAEKTLGDANEQMGELLQMAKCKNVDELPGVIARHAEYRELKEKIFDTEASLAKIGAGTSIADLGKRAAEIDADELPDRTASLRRDIEERINPGINNISQVIGEESTRLSEMDGRADAAVLAEKMEQELAVIRRLSEQYTRVKLASKILQREIERYREEHQDPVLKLASDYFRDLTLGSFSGLRTDVDDRGEPMLVGERPEGERLTVDKMSSGTRDQLYLSLRLATLEWRLETSEPMPFIVDDILINFDDDRSRATLSVLGEVSRRNQVILFTHHRRIVEQAMNIKGDRTIQIHEL